MDILLKSSVVLFENDSISQMYLLSIPKGKRLVLESIHPEYDFVGETERDLVRMKYKINLKLVDKEAENE